MIWSFRQIFHMVPGKGNTVPDLSLCSGHHGKHHWMSENYSEFEKNDEIQTLLPTSLAHRTRCQRENNVPFTV